MHTPFISKKKITTNLWLNYTLQPSLRYSFRYLTFNLFKIFFTNSKVDIPKVFLDFNALSRSSNQVNIFKFINYLMSNGNFLKLLIKLNAAWYNLLQPHSNNRSILSWYDSFLQINNNSNLVPDTKPSVNTTLNLFLTNFIRKAQPVFCLYMYKISKNIYKNTRGKSGKFMFLWKYVPTYKRLFVVISWLMRELRVIPQRKLSLRLVQLLGTMSQSPHKTWIHRVKYFSYNYVYRSCRKTLASTYISVKV
jgi:hypothetical protein